MDRFQQDMYMGMAIGISLLSKAKRQNEVEVAVEPTATQLASAERSTWNDKVEANRARKKYLKSQRKQAGE